MRSSRSANPRSTAFLLLAVLGGVWLASQLCFVAEPPGRDQYLFMAQADRLLAGDALYTDVWEHKPPGIVWIYALAMALLGRGWGAVQLASAAAALIAGWGLAWLLWRRTGLRAQAALAGCLYILFHSGPAFGAFWATAQPEVFMDPLLVAALGLLWGCDGRRGIVRAAGAGLCVGLMVLLKYSAAPLALMGLGVFARRALPVSARWARALAFCGGGALVGLALLAALGLTGGLGAFWEATIEFNLVHRRVAAASALDSLGSKLLFRLVLLAPLYTGMLAVWLLALWRWKRGPRSFVSMGIWALALWLMSLAGVFWQSKFWIYHYHVILLPLCLATGAALAGLAEGAPSRRGARAALVGACALLLTTPQIAALTTYMQDHRLLEYCLCGLERQVYEGTYTWGGTDYDAADTRAAAQRIRAETKPDDPIFVWGFEPGVYFLSGRRPASRFLYDYPLLPQFGALQERFVARLLADLRARPPRLFAVIRRDPNDLEAEDSFAQLKRIPPLADLLAREYSFAWEQGDFTVYRRSGLDRPVLAPPQSRMLESP
ncbi:MAG: glycosyltransferase family 39 protein [Deltaproteobacteria bacterium]|nr:glycosyltransferase family 39 protein [Deltaproteobacteria bacterium]